MPGIYGIRQGDNKKKPGGKERIMGSHRANAKGYNWIEGPASQPPPSLSHFSISFNTCAKRICFTSLDYRSI